MVLVRRTSRAGRAKLSPLQTFAGEEPVLHMTSPAYVMYGPEAPSKGTVTLMHQTPGVAPPQRTIACGVVGVGSAPALRAVSVNVGALPEVSETVVQTVPAVVQSRRTNVTLREASVALWGHTTGSTSATGLTVAARAWWAMATRAALPARRISTSSAVVMGAPTSGRRREGRCPARRARGRGCASPTSGRGLRCARRGPRVGGGRGGAS